MLVTPQNPHHHLLDAHASQVQEVEQDEDTWETTIPFAGFYESWHDQVFDDALEQMFSDEDGDPLGDLIDEAWQTVDWEKVRIAYSKEYVEGWKEYFDLPSVKFKNLDSPREYNFHTDRIFVTINLKDICKMLLRTDSKVFRDLVKESFTSRSGFTSHYDPDIDKWDDDVTTWDHNEIGTLVEAYCMPISQRGSSAYTGGFEEEYACNDRNCNGEIDEMICKADIDGELEKLFKVRELRMTRQRLGQIQEGNFIQEKDGQIRVSSMLGTMYPHVNLEKLFVILRNHNFDWPKAIDIYMESEPDEIGTG